MKFKVPKNEESFEKQPDLLLIDGGKGQLSSVAAVLKKLKLKIPLAAIAKQEEEIFIPGQSQPINLKPNTPASYLLQNIRDEAHRFAISFNRNLRHKKMTKSKLDAIPGIGAKNKKKLLQTFGAVSEIKKADINELKKLVGEKLAQKIKEQL